MAKRKPKKRVALPHDMHATLVADATREFLDWFEDNFADEKWLDPDFDPENYPDGVWRPYTDLPVYVTLKTLLG